MKPSEQTILHTLSVSLAYLEWLSVCCLWLIVVVMIAIIVTDFIRNLTKAGKKMPLDGDGTPHWASCPEARNFRKQQIGAHNGRTVVSENH